MNSKKTVWVTGAKGYIGSELVPRLEKAGYLIAATSSEVSITEQSHLDAFANEVRPDVIINCAGIPRRASGLASRINAYEVNALGAHNIAVVADAYDAKLVQISTDDVFPTRMSEPANEFDVPDPRGAYGKSKRAGEVLVRDTAENSLIVRSSWVYSVNHGMIKKALDAAKEGTKLTTRTDQLASPTSIDLYSRFILGAIEHDVKGILHIASKGVTNRHTLQSRALEICGFDPSEVLEPAEDLVTAEQVLLETMRLEMVGVDLPTWEDDLQSYLESQGLAK